MKGMLLEVGKYLTELVELVHEGENTNFFARKYTAIVDMVSPLMIKVYNKFPKVVESIKKVKKTYDYSRFNRIISDPGTGILIDLALTSLNIEADIYATIETVKKFDRTNEECIKFLEKIASYFDGKEKYFSECAKEMLNDLETEKKKIREAGWDQGTYQFFYTTYKSMAEIVNPWVVAVDVSDIVLGISDLKTNAYSTYVYGKLSSAISSILMSELKNEKFINSVKKSDFYTPQYSEMLMYCLLMSRIHGEEYMLKMEDHYLNYILSDTIVTVYNIFSKNKKEKTKNVIDICNNNITFINWIYSKEFLTMEPILLVTLRDGTKPINNSIKYGDELSFTFTSGNASENNYEWSISDTNILRFVSRNGNKASVIGNGSGTAYVILKEKSSGITQKYKVTVTSDIDILLEKDQINVNEFLELKAPTKSSDVKYEWKIINNPIGANLTKNKSFNVLDKKQSFNSFDNVKTCYLSSNVPCTVVIMLRDTITNVKCYKTVHIGYFKK